MSKKSKKTTIQTWMDEPSLFDYSKWQQELQELRTTQITQSITDAQHAYYRQQLHMQLYGGVRNGNRNAAAQAYSNTSNQSGGTRQLPQSAHQAAHQSINNALVQTRALHPGIFSWGTAVDPAIDPLKSAGVKFGEFLGWRMWFTCDGFLKSYSQDCVWAPHEPMTGTPSDYGSDGIWAFKDKHKALKKALESNHEPCGIHYLSNSGPSYVIYGSVHLYGLVIEHEIGYRAEKAKILTLDDIIGPGDSQNRKEVFQEIKKRYLA
jgi:hypothetical protein